MSETGSLSLGRPPVHGGGAPTKPRGHRPRLRAALVTSIAVWAGVVSTSLPGAAPAAAAANDYRLTTNEHLDPGERLISKNGRYVLVMQNDGNLVTYAPGNRPVWATNTFAAGSVVRMQDDGNLVVYAPGNVPVWASRTDRNPGAQVEMQDDGNVVVYGQGHAPKWAAGVPEVSSSLGDRIAAIAKAQEANPSRKFEQSGNCNWYTRNITNGASGCRAWCADFARWVWREAGARIDGLDARAAWFTKGYAGTTWRPSQSASGAHVGDAVVFDYDGKDWARHVGIVVDVRNGRLTVVEGNAGPKTDRVYLRTFTPNPKSRFGSERVSGYASPVQH